jgi:hypothetical protein
MEVLCLFKHDVMYHNDSINVYEYAVFGGSNEKEGKICKKLLKGGKA